MTAVLGAVDWGGTWIRVALVEGGRIRHRERIARPAEPADQYRAIAHLLHQCVTATGQKPAAVGIGVAGVVQRGVVVTAINIGITSTTDVRRSMAEQLGVPVVVVNDVQATAAGLAARWPDEVTAVITMGTGIGGAVIDRGRLLTGNGGAGDFGHIVVQVDGPRCPCGGLGCLETLVSGKVLAGAAESLAGQSEFLADRRASGRALHAGDLQDAAAVGDSGAQAVLERAATAFAAGVRTVVAALDPARIVVAGGLLADNAPFGRLARQRWAELRPVWCRTELTHVTGDEDAALLGAAGVAAASLGAG